MSVARTADRIDYWIRRRVHATDFSPADLRSTPRAIRRSRANGAPQNKLIPAPDKSAWVSIGHYLRGQYDPPAPPLPPHTPAPPVPPHIAALAEQLETQK